MRFAFTPESLAIRDSVRALLVRECTPGRVREAWSNADGRVPGLWAHLAALGVPGILAPEEHGGLGLTELELVLVLEESGRFAMPEPLVETAAVAVPLLRDVAARELLQARVRELVLVDPQEAGRTRRGQPFEADEEPVQIGRRAAGPDGERDESLARSPGPSRAD